MKYRKKPLIIDAVKYDKKQMGELIEFFSIATYNSLKNEYYISTLGVT